MSLVWANTQHGRVQYTITFACLKKVNRINKCYISDTSTFLWHLCCRYQFELCFSSYMLFFLMFYVSMFISKIQGSATAILQRIHGDTEQIFSMECYTFQRTFHSAHPGSLYAAIVLSVSKTRKSWRTCKCFWFYDKHLTKSSFTLFSSQNVPFTLHEMTLTFPVTRVWSDNCRVDSFKHEHR